MIAVCPRCGARYRIDEGRVPAEGVRLRCARCEATFRVSPRAASRGAGRAPGGNGAPRTPDRGQLVLIADAEVARGRETAAALAAWGLQSMLVHDGVEAIMALHRSQPRAAVLAAELPGMLGSQVCELVKRNPALSGVGIALVGSAADTPGGIDEAYGPDAQLDPARLPGGLSPILCELGLLLAEPARRPASEDPPAAAPQPAEPPAPSDDALPPQVADAERLARIVISDIILYNREKFDAALATGNVLEAMDNELEEGRALFRQRVDPRVLESRDFLADELMRVAQQRGG